MAQKPALLKPVQPCSVEKASASLQLRWLPNIAAFLEKLQVLGSFKVGLISLDYWK